MALKFKDIKDWKPSTISIVDQPSHPMAVFEVYEDDEEFVKKYITPEDKVEVMTKEDNEKNNVQFSEGIFEKLINGLVAKSEPQEPTEPPVQNNNEPVEDENKILEAIGKIDKRLDTMDARITKLEGGEKPPEPPKDDPVPGAVKKSEPPKDDDGGKLMWILLLLMRVLLIQMLLLVKVLILTLQRAMLLKNHSLREWVEI